MKHNPVRLFLCIILTAALLLTAVSAPAESGESHGGVQTNAGGSGGGSGSGGGVPQLEIQQDDRYAVTKEYRWFEESLYNYGMVIQNKSGAACGYLIDLTFLDGFGNRVGGAMKSVNTLDDGAEVLVQATCENPFERVQCKIQVISASYNDISAYVKVTAEKAGGLAIVKGVNTGNVDAESVEYKLIFLNDSGEAVASAWGYLIDADGVLKSGKTETRQVRCPVNFSSIDVYVTGRTDLDVVNTGTVEIGDTSSGSGVQVIREDTWGSPEWGYYYHGVVVKNTSGADAGIRAAMTFYDADNGIIGALNLQEDVCGDGYEICLVGIQQEPFDHAECTVELFETKYKAVQADIQFETSTNEYYSTVTATNTGEKTAEGVKYRVLFLDAEGKVVYSDWGYLSGDGSTSGALRPGETVSYNAYSAKPYESIAVYITGYRK